MTMLKETQKFSQTLKRRWDTRLGRQVFLELIEHLEQRELWAEILANLPSYESLDEKIDLRGIPLSGYHKVDINFSNCNLEFSNFSNSEFISCCFDNSLLSHSIFDSASLKKSSFENCFLTSVSFENADLRNVTFENAVLMKANFILANLDQTSFKLANLFGANFNSSKNFETALFENANTTLIIR